LAEAEARATTMVSEAIEKGSIQAINYFVADKYVGALRDLAMSPNQKVLMMPVEASSIIGAIGGIAELTREAMDGQRSANEGPSPSSRPPNVSAGPGAEG